MTAEPEDIFDTWVYWPEKVKGGMVMLVLLFVGDLLITDVWTPPYNGFVIVYASETHPLSLIVEGNDVDFPPYELTTKSKVRVFGSTRSVL